MSIRLVVLYILIAVLAGVSLRKWYWSLCGLLFVTVLTQNPSMPTMIGGVQGLNPWNATFAVIAFAWLLDRRRDPKRASASPQAVMLVMMYVALLCVIGLIAAFDVGGFRGEYVGRFTRKDVIIETMINPLKYLAVGVMFYDGALTRNRVKLALFSAVGSGLCYSLLMFKSLREKVFTINYSQARRVTDKIIGLFANDLAELTAFTLLAACLLVLIIRPAWLKALWLSVAVAAIPAFVALKSRAGFLAFCLGGLTLGVLRYRKLLLLLPAAVVFVIAINPSVLDRALQGVGAHSYQTNWDEVSAGRTTYLWPPTMEQIRESPIVGHGRYGILRTDCYDAMIAAGARGVPQHPHSAYLEILLDAGSVGFVICMTCFGAIAWTSWTLLRNRRDPLMAVLGGIGLAAVVVELTAALTGSSFYPTQSAVPYLCVWGVVLRVAAEQRAYVAARKSAAARPIMTEPLMDGQVDGA
ncbi:MAG: O-antigen ligase family protein [Phycisphaerales bacterium]|nr:O-antigen ligase family protein [Phycisphaerales bacterium]